ncbi:MAG: HU family DNA-binding protein [Mediterranea sp.]|nr:HU family DNA-binding protein [Mediterranea sp.]
MNNKEFTAELSRRTGVSVKETTDLIGKLIDEMTQELVEGNAVAILGFGTFDVKKKAERISVSPTTKQRMLVPPKLVLSFKPSSLLRDRVNKNQPEKLEL